MMMLEIFKRHSGFFVVGFLVFLSIILYVYITYSLDGAEEAQINPVLIAFQSVVSAVSVGSIIVLIDELGNRYNADKKNESLRISLETGNKELLRGVETAIETGIDTIKEDVEKIRLSTENALRLRFAHGFDNIVDNPDELRRIHELEKGSVRWLNTLFRHSEDNLKAILEAIERGIDVDLLMMSPQNNYAYVRGKYTASNYQDPSSIEDRTRAYQAALRSSFENIVDYYKTYLHMKELDQAKGEFRVRFYQDPAGLPILLLNTEHTAHAFTGFYINSYSSGLPYISWSRTVDGEDIVRNLQDYFDRKWYFAEETSIENVLSGEVVFEDVSVPSPVTN